MTFLDIGKTNGFNSSVLMTLAFDRITRFGSITAISTSGEKKACAYGDDQNLFEVLVDNRLMSATGTCMGNQACGKCQVKVISGNVAPIEDEEKEILGDAQPNHRLACAITLTADSDGTVLEVI